MIGSFLVNPCHFKWWFLKRKTLSCYLTFLPLLNLSTMTIPWGVASKRPQMWRLMIYHRPTSIPKQRGNSESCASPTMTDLCTKSAIRHNGSSVMAGLHQIMGLLHQIIFYTSQTVSNHSHLENNPTFICTTLYAPSLTIYHCQKFPKNSIQTTANE